MSDHASWPRARLRAGHVKRLYRLCSNSSPQTTDTVLTHAYTCLKLLRQDSKGIESSVAPRPYSTGGHRAALDVLLFSAVSLSPRCSKPTRDRTSILFSNICTTCISLNRAPFTVHWYTLMHDVMLWNRDTCHKNQHGSQWGVAIVTLAHRRFGIGNCWKLDGLHCPLLVQSRLSRTRNEYEKSILARAIEEILTHECPT